MADLNTPATAADNTALPAWFQLPDGETLPALLQRTLHSQAQRERWKYTKPERVLTAAGAGGTCIEFMPAEIERRTVDHRDADAPLAAADFGDLPEQAPEVLNALCAAGGLEVLEVTQSPAEPLRLRHQHSALPLLIRVAAGATLEVHEQISASLENRHQHAVWILLNANSRLIHARNNLGWQPAAEGRSVFRHLQVTLAADAHYALHNHSSGCAAHRQNIHICCDGAGAHAEISSAALLAAGTHLDQQITVQHRAAHSTSRQTIHNIAADKANVTFNGRIHIHAHAPGVQAHLTNKNLGMGDQATINTKPELEIYTDDVQCSHGATVGQLDDNHLFYCASRGIDGSTARSLLSRAFLKVCTLGPLASAALAEFDADAGNADAGNLGGPPHG